MKSKFLIITVLSFLFLSVSAQEIPMGTVNEGLAMRSAILGHDVNYAVYLPPDYQTSTRRYPVVYLLHGYSDDESGWIQFGEINLAVDQAIASREIPPMIIIMPDAKITWYMNNADGSERYEDMFVQELIPYVDQHYRTRAKKEFRGVSGLSMGGFGTLLYCLKHPDLFAAGAAFSSAVWTDEEVKAMSTGGSFNELFVKLFGLTKEKNLLTPHYRENSILDLAGSLPKEQIEKVRLYIDCGDDDFLSKGNCALHVLLRDRQIRHEYRVRDGGHSWSYWRSGIIDGLKFIGESFHR
jgi:enterochelin esterase-like enzyme